MNTYNPKYVGIDWGSKDYSAYTLIVNDSLEYDPSLSLCLLNPKTHVVVSRKGFFFFSVLNFVIGAVVGVVLYLKLF